MIANRTRRDTVVNMGRTKSNDHGNDFIVVSLDMIMLSTLHEIEQLLRSTATM